jgi:protein phosphatase 2C family protein 2/3
LNLTRGIGDFRHKKKRSIGLEKQAITSDPDVTCHEITDEDEFVVLATNGAISNICIILRI